MVLAGSELGRVALDGTDLRLDFAAAWVQPETPRLGQGDQHGFQRGVRWVLLRARVDGVLDEVLGRVSEGQGTVAGVRRSAWALPDAIEASIELELTTAQGARLRVLAQGLRIDVDAEAGWTESLAC